MRLSVCKLTYREDDFPDFFWADMNQGPAAKGREDPGFVKCLHRPISSPKKQIYVL